MCLDRVKKETSKNTYVKRMCVRVDGYVWLWKRFTVRNDDTLSGAWRRFIYYNGKNTAVGRWAIEINDSQEYLPGFHCYIKESDAVREKFDGEIVVPVKVKKSWITAVGHENWGNGNTTVIICKHIII